MGPDLRQQPALRPLNGAVHGRPTRLLRALGLIRDDGREITLTSAGAFWRHVVQSVFSIDGVGRLWSAAMQDAWPNAVVL